ncbi:uncharacterized protein LOC125650591 isoform X2 [Ostrea edulis]|uniref:uncharacterized protein LOC125650591 isoform X2 n=1 Tax=Ostrea edulis TaxID=37623 RepID=UPI0024AEBE99|nr:uncharacterized protein LOC125650591 isoform X2 [Ostrea edulis]
MIMEHNPLFGPPQLQRVIMPMPPSSPLQSCPKLDHISHRECAVEDDTKVGITTSTVSQNEEVQKHDQSFVSEKVLPVVSMGSSPIKPQSSLDMEGAMVDKAIENVLTLPQEFQEVMSMQKLQNNEIAKFEKCLSSILEQEKIAANNNEAILQDISSIDRKIYFTKESFAEKLNMCSKLTKDIEELITEVEQLNQKMKKSKGSLDEELKIIHSYEDKMKHYKIKSQNFEASSDLQGESLEIQERLNQLQTERNQSSLETACQETFNEFKEKFENQIKENKKLISENERQIADKYSQVRNFT